MSKNYTYVRAVHIAYTSYFQHVAHAFAYAVSVCDVVWCILSEGKVLTVNSKQMCVLCPTVSSLLWAGVNTIRSCVCDVVLEVYYGYITQRCEVERERMSDQLFTSPPPKPCHDNTRVVISHTIMTNCNCGSFHGRYRSFHGRCGSFHEYLNLCGSYRKLPAITCMSTFGGYKSARERMPRRSHGWGLACPPA